MNLAYIKIKPKTYTGSLNSVLYKVNADTKAAIRKIGLTISTLEGHDVILFSEILYCISDSNYTTIYCRAERKIIASKTLKVIEQALPQEEFFRIHRSQLISIEEVKKVTKTKVLMSNGINLPITPAKRIVLLNNMKNPYVFV
jgi:two-component system LytT family response regulator